MKYGIDISGWQHNVNYESVINNIDFAIIRAGFGVQYLPQKQKDSEFENHYNNLNSRVLLGCYYYQYAKEIGQGKIEAENCLKYIDGKTFDLPIFYDIEDGSIKGLDKETLTSIAREFVDTIKSAGYKAGIYASKSWVENKLDMSQFDDCYVWVASYGTNDGQIQENFKYNGKQDMWQYTSRGFVDGINGSVDMNILYSDIENNNDNNNDNNISENQNDTNEVEFTGNDTIRNIQQWLIDNYGYELSVDGYYGVDTKKKLVMALQHELNVQFNNNLAEDGIFGNMTKAACINLRQGATGNITFICQALLFCQGYDTNGVDGIFGSGTTSAVRRYQDNRGLEADGIIGKNTFEKLCK